MTHPERSPMHLQGVRYRGLDIARWSLGRAETWCVLGTNGSGKGLLTALLTSQAAPEAGTLQGCPKRVLAVSLEGQQALYEEELRRDESNFGGGVDEGRTVRQLLLEGFHEPDRAAFQALSATLRLTPLLDRGYRRLSSGEARALLLARYLLAEPELLILDEPFESLDTAARATVIATCARLAAHGQRLLLLVNRLQDIAPFVTHVAVLHRGRLLCQGPRTAIVTMPEVSHLMQLDRRDSPALPSPPAAALQPWDPLVAMRRCTVKYGDVLQFEPFSWTLRPGEHTLITGPNGAGKSTLLQLISGDHPQCYANDIRVFGYQRGTGESIWDIKQHIGLVSAAIHRDHRVGGDVLSTVVSGLHDTIGVYRRVRHEEVSLARAWLAAVGLSDHPAAPFRSLSYGQQRLVLIARGLIKQPPLLILDEPAHGLDDVNQQLVLAFIEQLARLERTTLLLVSHRPDEHLALFTRRLTFGPASSPDAHYRIVVSS